MKEIIQGKRINLRRLKVEDISIVLKWLTSSDYSYFIEEIGSNSSKEVLMYINSLIEENRREKGEVITFLIMNKRDISKGIVSFFQIDWENKNCRMNIFLPNDERRSIYGAEAIVRSWRYAFNKMDMHKMYGHIYEDNKNSMRLCEKFGAKKEAIMRNSIIKNGFVQNIFIYGILRKEWREKEKKLPFGK